MPRHPFDDVAVDGRPDAEGEHVGIAQVVPDEIEDLFLDGHVAVGGNDDGPGRMILFFQGQGPLQGGQQFRTSTAPLPIDELDGPCDVFLRGRKRLLGHD
jgi:hypothetical protein